VAKDYLINNNFSQPGINNAGMESADTRGDHSNSQPKMGRILHQQYTVHLRKKELSCNGQLFAMLARIFPSVEMKNTPWKWVV
jgi:hypothetical protein